jgi:hypothetical protein
MAEGFRRIGKIIGYAGWLPLIIVILDAVARVTEGDTWPHSLPFNLMCAAFVIVVTKGIEWVITGFASPKRQE